MASPKERRLWLDGYESAIRYIYATADQDPEILQEFMDRAEDRVEAEIEAMRDWLDTLSDEQNKN